MKIEVTPRELQLLVESLRTNEKNSQQGFATWLSKNIDSSTDPNTIADKAQRAAVVWKELATLRERLRNELPEQTKGEK